MKYFVSVFMLFFITVLHDASVSATPPPSADIDPKQHQFTQMDTNNDGYVSYDEFRDWHSNWLEWKFQHIDSDDDGYLSGDEFHKIDQKGKSEINRREEVSQGAPLK
jgi:Ca2+-binding EF-hand superfamily protein